MATETEMKIASLYAKGMTSEANSLRKETENENIRVSVTMLLLNVHTPTHKEFDDLCVKTLGYNLNNRMEEVYLKRPDLFKECFWTGASVEKIMRVYARSTQRREDFFALIYAFYKFLIVTKRIEENDGTYKNFWMLIDGYHTTEEIPKPMHNELLEIMWSLGPDTDSGKYTDADRVRDNVDSDRLERIEGNTGSILSMLNAHLTPRRDDYAVTQQGLADILDGLNVRTTTRQIQRWEAYLRGDVKNNTKPPDGYTLKTRLTSESATAWAKSYADKEKSKLNLKISLDRFKGGQR